MNGKMWLVACVLVPQLLCSAASIHGAVDPEPAQNPKPSKPDSALPRKEEKLPAGSFDLRPKFRVGQDRRVRLSLDSHETAPDLTLDPAAPASKAADEMKTKQDFVLVFRPIKVGEDGRSEVGITFESIRSHVEGPGVDDSFDSSRPAPKPAPNPAKPDASDPLGGLGKMPTLEETMRPLVGDSFTIVFDRDGNVTEVRGGDKFVRALNPLAPEGLMQTGDAPIRELMKSIVSPAGKTHAKPGESWSTDTSLDLFPIGGTIIRTDYKLSDVRGARGRIGFAGKLAPKSDASPGAAGLRLSKVEFSGQTDWDQEDGFARSMDSSQKIEAEIGIGQQTIPIKQSQRLKLERLPDAKPIPQHTDHRE